MSDALVLPNADRDSEHYWAALANGRFEIQQCSDCGHWTWPPRPVCSFCHGESLDWQPVKGTGEVHSWVITHQNYLPSLAPFMPYTIALVRIDEQDDILIPGRLLSPVEVRQGLRVRGAPERLTEEVGVLHWEAVASEG